MEKRRRYLIIGICSAFALVLGTTLAWYTWTSTNTDVTLTIGGVTVTYEAGDDITDVSLRPVLNKDTGVTNNYAIKKDITVSSIKTTYFNLYLSAELFPVGLKDASLKWEIYEGSTKLNEGNFANTVQGDTITLLSNTEINFTTRSLSLYIWIDGNMSNPSSMQNQDYRFVLNATATDETPVLTRTSEQMIEHLGLTSLVKTGTPTFANVATTDEGIYTAEDDLGVSYYFRGASENNYVYFAEHYWRIVRINGDGTIRMIYDGTTKHENGETSIDRQLPKTAYNASSTGVANDNAGVGYMYGAANQSTYEATHANTNPSTIKGVLDTWYANNIDNTEYEQYIADVIYCNDRKVGSTGNGIGKTNTYYASRDRLIESIPSPTLKCSQQNDRFTQSVELGNGALATTYPIGLITADEVAMAGGKSGSSNNQYYLYNGQNYWTMSPYIFVADDVEAYVWIVNSSGFLLGYHVAFTYIGARPIVSLKSDVELGGDGSYETPFYIK